MEENRTRHSDKTRDVGAGEVSPQLRACAVLRRDLRLVIRWLTTAPNCSCRRSYDLSGLHTYPHAHIHMHTHVCAHMFTHSHTLKKTKNKSSKEGKLLMKQCENGEFSENF